MLFRKDALTGNVTAELGLAALQLDRPRHRALRIEVDRGMWTSISLPWPRSAAAFLLLRRSCRARTAVAILATSVTWNVWRRREPARQGLMCCIRLIPSPAGPPTRGHGWVHRLDGTQGAFVCYSDDEWNGSIRKFASKARSGKARAPLSLAIAHRGWQRRLGVQKYSKVGLRLAQRR